MGMTRTLVGGAACCRLARCISVGLLPIKIKIVSVAKEASGLLVMVDEGQDKAYTF